MIFIFILYTLPFLAVLALSAFIADVILPHFPALVDWIEDIMKPRW